MKHRPVIAALFTGILLLPACGGGGGGGSAPAPAPDPTPPPAANAAPIASAGDDRSVLAGAVVTLDASASSDSDGEISTWSWQQTEGPGVLLNTPDEPVTTFSAPDVTDPATLVFSVTVTDDDGATDADSVSIAITPVAPQTRVSISGQVLPSLAQALDSDTNDPSNPFIANDTLADAQSIPAPITLGGYVNEAGTGTAGQSFDAGDSDDYFSTVLRDGQRITLLVAEPDEGDADLYLYDSDGRILDFSVETDGLEVLEVPADGSYFISVNAFSGATNYTLFIGASDLPTSSGLAFSLNNNRAIVEVAGDAESGGYRELLRREGMAARAGSGRRLQLLELRSAVTAAGLHGARHLADAFRQPEHRARWETLLRIKSLRQQPEVAMAEPDYRVQALAAPDDTFYPFQWHYPMIGLPAAWDTTTGDAGTIVAVVDTGILSRHPDLVGQLVPGFDFVRDPAVAADGDGIDPDPEEAVGADSPRPSYHGSHVAGTIAAAGNNGLGVAGVAYGARLMPLRALGNESGSSYDVLQAVRFAAGLPNDSGEVPAEPASIINLSLGSAGYSQIAQNLYLDLYQRGIVVVAAAGNESSTRPNYPAAYDGVLGVSAVDIQRRLASYSNRGAQVDVAAPGGDGSADVNGDGYPDGVLSTAASDEGFAYSFLSGTSMASPHVAGVVALMQAANPELDAAAIFQLLQDGELTDDLGPAGRDDQFGFGLINAERAVLAALNLDRPTQPEDRLSASPGSLNFGERLTDIDVNIAGSGGGEVQLDSIEVTVPWARVSALAVDASGLGIYRVSVDREGLGAGLYAGQLIARSAASTLAIDLLLAVGSDLTGNIGTVYVLVYDPENETTVAQARAVPGSGDYRYTLQTPPGRFSIFAGSDMDNDLFVCDAGESCGAHLTLETPALLDIDADIDGVDIPVEYRFALPAGPSTLTTSDPDRTVLQRSRIPQS